LPADEVRLTVVIGRFDARSGREAQLSALLARYVVLTRRRDGCRNVDLVASVLHPGRFVVVEKWESPEVQRTHLDAPETVELAKAAVDVLAGPPDLDLFEAISAHDLE
jgi:quinol monooxygenase YgiN